MKFLCVNDSKRAAEHFQEWVEVGKEYTLRSTRATLEVGVTGMLFEEVRNKSVFFPALGGYAEPGFDSKRFIAVEDVAIEAEQEEYASI